MSESPADGVWIEGVGPPVPRMVAYVKELLAEGLCEVRIFTARVSAGGRKGDTYTIKRDCQEQERLIQTWCASHLGRILKVTCEKDLEMIALYDDRAVQVIHNTGGIMEVEPAMALLAELLDAYEGQCAMEPDGRLVARVRAQLGLVAAV